MAVVAAKAVEMAAKEAVEATEAVKVVQAAVRGVEDCKSQAPYSFPP